MIKVEGKGGISATVVADSVSEAGVRITTFELEYPRFIHSEFMTHRQFSRNAASSRAIPIEKMIEQVETNPAMPIHWGKNQSGMQAKEEVDDVLSAQAEWEGSAYEVGAYAEVLQKRGLHKQIVNRLLEPYQMIKVVCTATEYDNFFYLRLHEDAQPEICELAYVMCTARDKSAPQELMTGEWHLPYLQSRRDGEGLSYFSMENDLLSLEDAIKISASLCAQVSYRKADESLDKALKIYDMLVTMKPVHASPFEHQATPIDPHIFGTHKVEGATHEDRYGDLWSGNFRGWVQNRQLIPNHVFNGENK